MVAEVNETEVANRNGLAIPHQEYKKANEIPFRYVRRLGQGSSGEVDEVEALSKAAPLTGNFARKVIWAGPRLRPNFRLIQDEVDTIKHLQHRHIIQVLATYSLGAQFALIMTPVTETNLQDYLAANSITAPQAEMYH